MEEVAIHSLWAINDPITIDKAKDQIDFLKESGLKGVIFHPRYYPGPPEYLSKDYFNLVNQIILYCKEIDMTFWLYDENGWPSGTAGGKVIQTDQSLRKEHVELIRSGRDADYSRTKVYPGNHRFGWIAERKPSPIDRHATEIFLELVYEGYRQGLSEEAFNYVTGFFSDETALPMNKQIPSIPWSSTIAESYQKHSARDLNVDLPALFFDDCFSKEETSKIRTSFWETAADELRSGFYEPLSNWCRKHGKHYLAHLRGEENISFSIPFSGSPFQVLKAVETPAVDALERFPNNYYYPRIASSLAKQFGSGASFCEALGGAGWGIEPVDVQNYFRWLTECGIDQFCIHINQYTFKTQAMKDWPPSIPNHLSWKKVFPSLMKDIYEMNRVNGSVGDTLIVVPVRGIMAVYNACELSQTDRHRAAFQPDTLATKISLKVIRYINDLQNKGISFDVIDERTLEQHGLFIDRQLQIGNAAYRRVYAFEECCFLDAQTEGEIRSLSPAEDWKVAKKRQQGNAVSNEKMTESVQQSEWSLIGRVSNTAPFGEDAFENGICHQQVDFQSPLSVFIESSDRLKEILVNGQPVDITQSVCLENDHYHYPVNRCLIQTGKNDFRLSSEHAEIDPLCWLTGDFKVRLTGRQITEDHYRATESYVIEERDDHFRSLWLSDQGFPFQINPLWMEKTIQILEPCNAILRIDSLKAPACRLIIDGTVLDYWNGRDPERCRIALKTGSHRITCELYPSNFSAYGPNHYLYGDRFVISPGQFTGKKNFADQQSSPEKTSYDYFNYKALSIGDIFFIDK
ncbi:MAG: hypothetical protein ABF651_03580 [Sporolactobacillus sp.]